MSGADQIDRLRYAVVRQGIAGGKDEIEAAFVYARAAEAYRMLCYPVGGAEVQEMATGKRVRGVTNHGRAILDTLQRAKP